MGRKRPGEALQYRPGQDPDGVWRNPYGELETPAEVKHPAAMSRFNALVDKYYDFVSRDMKEQATRSITSAESACRLLGLSSIPTDKAAVMTAYKEMIQYSHPDKNEYIGVEKYSEACAEMTKRITEARDLLIKKIEEQKS